MRKIISLAFLTLAIMPLMATAGSSTQPLQTGNYLQVILVLGLIIALILGCSYLLRRVNFIGKNISGTIKVISGLSIGTREKIVLVDVGGKQILVGIAPGQIQALHVFEEPIIAPSTTKESAFPQQLEKLIRQGKS